MQESVLILLDCPHESRQIIVPAKSILSTVRLRLIVIIRINIFNNINSFKKKRSIVHVHGIAGRVGNVAVEKIHGLCTPYKSSVVSSLVYTGATYEIGSSWGGFWERANDIELPLT